MEPEADETFTLRTAGYAQIVAVVDRHNIVEINGWWFGAEDLREAAMFLELLADYVSDEFTDIE